MATVSSRIALAALLVGATPGCTVIGIVQGVQSANADNRARERAIERGDSRIPPSASAASRGFGYGLIGFTVDCVLFVLVAPRLVPGE